MVFDILRVFIAQGEDGAEEKKNRLMKIVSVSTVMSIFLFGTIIWFVHKRLHNSTGNHLFI